MENEICQERTDIKIQQMIPVDEMKEYFIFFLKHKIMEENKKEQINIDASIYKY